MGERPWVSLGLDCTAVDYHASASGVEGTCRFSCPDGREMDPELGCCRIEVCLESPPWHLGHPYSISSPFPRPLTLRHLFRLLPLLFAPHLALAHLPYRPMQCELPMTRDGWRGGEGRWRREVDWGRSGGLGFGGFVLVLVLGVGRVLVFLRG